MNTLLEIKDYLFDHDNFMIMGHVDPDGDSIGSVFSLKWILDSLNKNSIIVLDDNPRLSYDLLNYKQKDYILCTNLNSTNNYESVIVLDSGELSRIGERDKLINNKKILNLDHHIDNALFGDLNYLNADMAATGEIIFELAAFLKVPVDEKIGYAIATAILTDTGFMRYKNTSPHILNIISALMDIGVDIHKIYRALFASHSYKSMRLRGMALNNLKLGKNGKFAYLYVDKEILEELDADESISSGLVNYPRDIKGVEVGLSFVEKEDNIIKVSLRSNEYCPVNEIASRFNGGGHERAAGCKVEGNMNKVIDRVITEVKKFV